VDQVNRVGCGNENRSMVPEFSTIWGLGWRDPDKDDRAHCTEQQFAHNAGGRKHTDIFGRTDGDETVHANAEKRGRSWPQKARTTKTAPVSIRNRRW
jgi:hypothetical protein